MTTCIAFVVHTHPVPKGRPRMTRGGRAYTPARTLRYERLIAAHARRAYRGAPMTGPAKIRVDAYWERPKRPSKGHPCRTGPAVAFPLALGGKYGDASNILKAVEDAANGVVWADDSQVTECVSARWWAAVGEPSRVEVTCWVDG